MTALPRPAIVIPQKRHSELTRRLVEQIHQFEPTAEIVVVNDDPDDTPSFANALVLPNAGSGVTAAWNTGVAAVAERGTTHVVLLNNDVICSGRFAAAFMAAGNNHVVGVADRFDPDIRRRLLEGWCLAFPVSLWKHLGGFDESMALYFSDTDFQVRALEAGCGLQVVGVPLTHLGHRTAHDAAVVPNRRAQWLRDRQQFRAKHLTADG